MQGSGKTMRVVRAISAMGAMAAKYQGVSFMRLISSQRDGESGSRRPGTREAPYM